MNEAGRARCTEWAGGLAALGPPRIFHSSDDLATETAKLLARALGASTRKLRELDEIDLGLWAGLTEAQLRSRFRNAYHQLTESPLTVVPPEGEPIADAVERIGRALNKRIMQNSLPAAAFVLRPMAMAAARCHLENRPLSELWAESHYDGGPLLVDRATPFSNELQAPAHGVAEHSGTTESDRDAHQGSRPAKNPQTRSPRSTRNAEGAAQAAAGVPEKGTTNLPSSASGAARVAEGPVADRSESKAATPIGDSPSARKPRRSAPGGSCPPAGSSAEPERNSG